MSFWFFCVSASTVLEATTTSTCINAKEEEDNENGLNGLQEEEMLNDHQQQQEQLDDELLPQQQDDNSSDTTYPTNDDYDDAYAFDLEQMEYKELRQKIEQNVSSLTKISRINLCNYWIKSFGLALQTNTHLTDMTINISGLDYIYDDTGMLRFIEDSSLFLQYLRTSKSLLYFALISSDESSVDSTTIFYPSWYILDAIAQNGTVRCVVIDEINVYDSLASLLRKPTSIQKLELRFCSFEKQDSVSPSSKLTKEVNLQEVSSALTDNTTIQSLIIFSISDPLLIISILDGIMNNSSIQDLSISTPEDDTNLQQQKQILNLPNSILATSKSLQGLELVNFHFTTDLFRPIANGIMNRTIPLKTLSLYNFSFESSDTIITMQKIAREHVYTLRLGGQLEPYDSMRANGSNSLSSRILCNILQTPQQLIAPNQSTSSRTHMTTTLQHIDLERLEYCDYLFTTEFCNTILLNTKILSLAIPSIGCNTNECNYFLKQFLPICTLKKLNLQAAIIFNVTYLMNSLYRNLSLEKVILNSDNKLFTHDLVLCVHEYCARNRSIRQSIQMVEWIPEQQKSTDNVTNQDKQEDYCPISITSLWPHVFESIQDCDTKLDVIFKCISRVLIDSIGSCVGNSEHESSVFGKP